MGDGRAERSLRSRLRIDVNELPVLGGVGELIDPLLVIVSQPETPISWPILDRISSRGATAIASV